MRRDWNEYFMAIARVVATRATCDRKHVGAVITRDRNILATGYNGSLPGQHHCDDVGHLMEDGHCVPGDTVVSKFQTGAYNSGHRTIKEIYEQWQDPQKRGAMVRMRIRSVTPEGMIVPDRITDVWKSGPKKLFRLTTRLGRSVRTTADHLIRAAPGWARWVQMSDLSVLDKVALNGQPLYDDKEWLRRVYVDEGMSQVSIATLVGCNRKTIQKRLDEFGIERREFRLGGWNKGLRREETPRYGGRGVSPTHARERARRYALKSCCQVCGSQDNLQVHHLDGDVWNDSDANLLTTCVSCHNLAHTPHAKREKIVFDYVTSVVEDGFEEVYDLTTELNHNFVGDGIVLHNCVRTNHAEANAICQAAKNGVRLEGATIYVTASPCWPCFKLIASTGIKRIVFGELYRDERITGFADNSKIELLWLKPRSDRDALNKTDSFSPSRGSPNPCNEIPLGPAHEGKLRTAQAPVVMPPISPMQVCKCGHLRREHKEIYNGHCDGVVMSGSGCDTEFDKCSCKAFELGDEQNPVCFGTCVKVTNENCTQCGFANKCSTEAYKKGK